MERKNVMTTTMFQNKVKLTAIFVGAALAILSATFPALAGGKGGLGASVDVSVDVNDLSHQS